MTVGGDLAKDRLAGELRGRQVRSYPALLATEPEAMAWARAGAPAGALVVADYQAAPRGRGGQPWRVTPGHGLGFSLVLRPQLSPEREGWLYVAASVALADALTTDDDVRLQWPDTVLAVHGSDTRARLGMISQPGEDTAAWAVLTVLVEDAVPPRGPLLARLAAAVEARLDEAPADVLPAYRLNSVTLGQQVHARMMPLGPTGAVISGEAVDVLADGALAVRTARGNRVAVRPQHLGVLELVGPPGGAEPRSSALR